MITREEIKNLTIHEHNGEIPKGHKFPENVQRLIIWDAKEWPENTPLPEGLVYLLADGIKRVPADFRIPAGVRKLVLGVSTLEGIKLPEGLEDLMLGKLEDIPSDFEFPRSLEFLYYEQMYRTRDLKQIVTDKLPGGATLDVKHDGYRGK